MTTHSLATAAAILAFAASAAPMVCQAQAPGTFQQQAFAALKANNYPEALKIIDQCISKYGSPTSRVGKQFSSQLGWFYYQKGICLMQIKGKDGVPDYNAALEAFKTCHTDPRFANIDLNPFRNFSLFQMGQCEFQMGKQDPSHYQKAIDYFNQYLDIYNKKRGLSQAELRAKPEAQIYVLIAQSNILKPTPDFKAAETALNKARSQRTKLPDELLMNTAKSFVSVAISPEVNSPELAYRTIASSPENFNLGSVRSAAYAGDFLNFGFKAYNLGREAIAAGDMAKGEAYCKLAMTLLGLVPETNVAREDLQALVKAIGPINANIPDSVTTYNGPKLRRLLQQFNTIAKDHINLEANAMMATANVMLNFGSKRGGKAAYQILEDRYANMQRRTGEDTFEPLREDNLYQLAMCTRATGDIANAEKLENKHRNLFPDSKYFKGLLINELARLMKEQRYEEAIDVAHSIMDANQEEPLGESYTTASFSEVASLFKLQKYADLLPLSAKFLKDHPDNPKYSSQVLFFQLIAQKELGQTEACMKSAEEFMEKFPDVNLETNPYLPFAYYSQIDNYVHRSAEGDADKALVLIDKFAADFPKHELFPTTQLIKANILLNKDDVEDNQIKALAAYKLAYETAKDDPKTRVAAANALFCLASYTAEIEVPGKDEKARMDEANGYIKEFWEKSDYEGNPFSLQVAALELDRSMGDEAAFTRTSKHLQEIITREAKFALGQDKINPDLEGAVNSYTENYIDGMKKFGKELTLDQIRDRFYNFPGIDPKDNYTRAILRMAVINQMSQALNATPKDATAERGRISDNIEKVFREMVNTFAPKDLTEFINVQVGNYLVDFVSRFDNPASKNKERLEAITYFDEVLNRNKKYVNEAIYGKARALGLSDNPADMDAGIALMQPLTKNADAAVAQNAMVTLTRLYMKKQDYANAIATASAYIDNRRNTKDRLPMLMLLGEAFAASGDIQNGILTYMNLYNQNIGRIQYSAPACEAIMKLMWQRNKPKTATDASDRWKAWNQGRIYINSTEPNESKFTPEDRDVWRPVRQLTEQYGSDPAVMAEEKERRHIRAQIQKNK